MEVSGGTTQLDQGHAMADIYLALFRARWALVFTWKCLAVHEWSSHSWMLAHFFVTAVPQPQMQKSWEKRDHPGNHPGPS